MQTTVLPVEPLVTLSSLVDGQVKHQHGSYNMGLVQTSEGYTGIFRNCTRNARHLLGLPYMGEGIYENVLYAIKLRRDFKLLHLWQVVMPQIVHDVRLSKYGMIGCEKLGEDLFHPCMVKFGAGPAPKIEHIGPHRGKNYNYLPDGTFDCGYVDGKGMGRMQMILGTGAAFAYEPHPIAFRGSAPYFHIGERMITTYHRWIDDGGKRNYFQYFAELEPRSPFNILRHSCPFKIGRGGEPGRIQFLMACFPFRDDPKHFLVSYGEADADNTVGLIKTADILGLLQ